MKKPTESDWRAVNWSLSNSEIARQKGVSVLTVSNWRRRLSSSAAILLLAAEQATIPPNVKSKVKELSPLRKVVQVLLTKGWTALQISTWIKQNSIGESRTQAQIHKYVVASIYKDKQKKAKAKLTFN